MSSLMRLVGLLVIVLIVGAIMAGCSYNRFVTQEEAVKTQWSQVENQLQRRSDLIPNLVETVKGFAAQEKAVFQAVADARAQMAGARTTPDRVAAANAETSALARLLVVVENYPQLKSDATFMRLMDELSGTENRLSQERRRFNEVAQTYNVSRRSFPGNITAAIFGFPEYPTFQAPEAAKTVPKVDFKK